MEIIIGIIIILIVISLIGKAIKFVGFLVIVGIIIYVIGSLTGSF